jgi:hypothetical protein
MARTHFLPSQAIFNLNRLTLWGKPGWPDWSNFRHLGNFYFWHLKNMFGQLFPHKKLCLIFEKNLGLDCILSDFLEAVGHFLNKKHLVTLRKNWDWDYWTDSLIKAAPMHRDCLRCSRKFLDIKATPTWVRMAQVENKLRTSCEQVESKLRASWEQVESKLRRPIWQLLFV